MIIAEILLFFCIFHMLFGVLKGDNIPCKIMSFCCLTNYVVVLLCFWGLFKGKESFIDIAYIFVLLGFIMNLSLTKLKSFRIPGSVLLVIPEKLSKGNFIGDPASLNERDNTKTSVKENKASPPKNRKKK